MRLLPSCLSLLILAILASNAHADAGVHSGNAPSSQRPEVQQLVAQANSFLSSGKFNDAIRAYSEAIELNPDDYLLYYKRATAYYSLSRHSQALADFDTVVSRTAGAFDKALLMQGRIHAKEGSWTAARDALSRYLSLSSSSANDRATASNLLTEITSGEASARLASQSHSHSHAHACVDAANDALRVAPHSFHLRELRAQCALAAGDHAGALGDLVRLAQLTQQLAGNHHAQAAPSLLLRIARLAYFILPPEGAEGAASASASGASGQAQTALKQCLHLDPDSRACAALHREIKKLDKAFARLAALREAGDWRGVVSHVYGDAAVPKGKEREKETKKETNTAVLGTGLAAQFESALLNEAVAAAAVAGELVDLPKAPQRISARRRELVRVMCQAYVKLGQARRADWWCEELLRFELEGAKEDVDGLVGRGEAALAKEQFEEAVRAFEKAFEASGRSSQDILHRLQKAQRLVKQSRKKDYYKVLGVSRDADERTIKKAYYKVAKTAHPDKGGSEERMATVNEAYEVLSNPELRARFDNGDDPNNPTGGQGAGSYAHPFFAQGAAHPFMQFFQGSGAPGGGGFTFKHHSSGGAAAGSAGGGGDGGPFQFHFRMG